ncbi:MAG TPA: WHG domain-containing protein [Streptosporangiaceae bacterium]|nr:WHG domain-containing protein [Streptosporangiaceae bacterium]
MPRAGLSAAAVTDIAIAIIDDEGVEALTLTAVAKRAGVAAPSLYKHVRSVADLHDHVAAHVVAEMRERLAAAVMGRSLDDATRALMRAYRDYVISYPNRYAVFPQAPPRNPDLAAAADRLLDVALALLRGYGLEGTQAVHAARCLRSVAHGFASLQAAGAFELPENLDISYDYLTGMLTDGIARIAADQAA